MSLFKHILTYWYIVLYNYLLSHSYRSVHCSHLSLYGSDSICKWGMEDVHIFWESCRYPYGSSVFVHPMDLAAVFYILLSGCKSLLLNFGSSTGDQNKPTTNINSVMPTAAYSRWFLFSNLIFKSFFTGFFLWWGWKSITHKITKFKIWVLHLSYNHKSAILAESVLAVNMVYITCTAGFNEELSRNYVNWICQL